MNRTACICAIAASISWTSAIAETLQPSVFACVETPDDSRVILLVQKGTERFVGAPEGRRERAVTRDDFELSVHSLDAPLADLTVESLEAGEPVFEGTGSRMVQTVQFISRSTPDLFFLFNLETLEGTAILPGEKETSLACRVLS